MCEIDSEHLTPDRVSLLAETRFTTYFCEHADLRVLKYAHVPTMAGCEWNVARNSAQRPASHWGKARSGVLGRSKVQFDQTEVSGAIGAR